MKYNQRTGTVYDTFFYGVLYFNLTATKDYFDDIIGCFDDAYANYDALKKIMPELPKSLYPFFHTNWVSKSFIMEYWFTKWDFFNGTFDDCITVITQDKTLKQQLFTHFIDSSVVEEAFDKNNFIELTQRIIELDYDNDLKIYLINMVFDFNNQLDSLIQYLSQAYLIIDNYHRQMYNADNTIYELTSTKYLQKLKSYCTIEDSVKLNQQLISLSYLNSYLIAYKFDNNNHYSFILSKYSELVLDKFLKYSFVRPEDVFVALAHPVKREILDCLYVSEYTATQLSERLNVSRQSINHHLLSLNDFMFITISRRVGPEIYYTVNNSYFKEVRPLINSFLMKYETPYDSNK